MNIAKGGAPNVAKSITPVIETATKSAGGYFDLPEVSCSDLKALERGFYAKPDPFSGDRRALLFGSLVDTFLTDHALNLHGRNPTGRLDYTWMSLTDETGVIHHYDKQTWDKAVRMAYIMREDQVVKPLLSVSLPQYIFRRTLTFEFDGAEYQIRGRCMFDLYAKSQHMGLDYKMLAITSQKQLIESIDWFDYDMQAAYYMDLARTNYHWVAAGSKPNEKVYKYAIERGSEMYERGRQKYTRWAYYWLILIADFNNYQNEIH